MIFLMLWTFQITHWSGGMIWFGLALVFSLLGDIALLLSPRYFLAGVGAFFLAHLSYVIGFNQQPAPFALGPMIMAVLVGMSSARVFRVLRPGVTKVSHGKRIFFAISLYGLTLTLMLLFSLITLFRSDWAGSAAILSASGGILFYISDTLLGYDRFVRRIKHGQSYVHLTYHLGQIGLVTGAMIFFLK